MELQHRCRGKSGAGNLAITYHQFSLNLATIYHYPNEVMRVCGLFGEKKLKKFVTIT